MQQNSNLPPDGTALTSEPADVPELDAKTQLLLGQALQAHYDDLASAPVPDRFLALLAELEAKELREKP